LLSNTSPVETHQDIQVENIGGNTVVDESTSNEVENEPGADIVSLFSLVQQQSENEEDSRPIFFC